jgi:predicted DNA-binding transcriptional regulator YafY
MARTRTEPAAAVKKTVTAERAARLYRLLQLLAAGPQTRAALMRRLRLDVRGFYRDLELLRSWHIDLPLVKGRYTVAGAAADAVARLPFPDPGLTLTEAIQLAKGRTAVHRKLKAQIDAIIGKRR